MSLGRCVSWRTEKPDLLQHQAQASAGPETAARDAGSGEATARMRLERETVKCILLELASVHLVRQKRWGLCVATSVALVPAARGVQRQVCCWLG